MANEKLQVATEILNQLGGNRFIMMTGVKHICGDVSSLSMKLPRNLSGASHLTIKLNSMDTYDMEFIKIFKFQRTVKKEVVGIYNDQLQSIFSQNTGLATRLF